MGVVIPVGFAQVVAEITCVGKVSPLSITIGAEATGVISASEVAEAYYDAFTELGSLFDSNPSDTWSNLYTFVGVHVTKMQASGPVLADFGTPITGLGPIATVPINGAILARKSTERGGRKGRGRWFLPPVWVPEGSIDQVGGIAAPVLNLIQTRLQTFLSAASTSVALPVLLHQDELTPPDPITAITVQSLLATQRRRMRS